MDADAILSALNPRQREAATAVRGPVAILAGAGTGKTTTITHRIAFQVASRVLRPDQILAVTFTERAATELKARLRRLGVEGVEARTVHSAALAQLSRLWPVHVGTPLGEVLDAKAPILASLASALPPPHRFVPRRDLAAEIEWAKNRMVGPDRYQDELIECGHAPPIPAELMHRIYAGYERRKTLAGRLDFEDMLGLAVSLFDEHPAAADTVHARFAALTVDEYQDVNPLQAALLDRWIGERDDVCVVGDDYQTIYGFTGAAPVYLLGFKVRFPHARLVRLEANYRSTPEILATANRLAECLGGFEKRLRATRPTGPAPLIGPINGELGEVEFVVEEVGRLHQTEGVPFEEMAVLYRINARSESFEAALARAGLPYQVRDGAFLRRPGPRGALHRLRRESGPEAAAVERVLSALGVTVLDDAHGAESPEEVTRRADLARLRALAAEFEASRPDGDLSAFLSELTSRFSAEASGRGIHLMTYHRAKGLEFDAVFLPRLLDGELPFRSGRSRAPIEEERRLLYVGITRARRWLFLTWPAGEGHRMGRSPFIEELASFATARGAARSLGTPAGGSSRQRHDRSPDEPLLKALKRWRLERCRADGVPAFVVFHDSTLAAISERQPRTLAELRSISGVGPAKIERYGPDVLETLAGTTRARDVDPGG